MESQVMLEDTTKDRKSQENEPKRIMWHNKFEFAFNVIGYNVGLGNIWRFTYLCFKDGGGAFLIPYLLVAAFCGIPILFMEVSMGQFTRQGCIAGWDLVPLTRGVGFAAMLMSIYFLIYFALAIAWCLIYLIRSFTLHQVPWATCDNYWNSDDCIPIIDSGNISNSFSENYNITNSTTGKLSTAEFWDDYVLQRSGGIHDLGGFSNWPMLGCFIASWVLSYFCIAKGIRTSGKVAYLTVLLPYVLMVVLFIRGLTLEGAGNGVLFYITPNVTKLGDPEVWLDAGSQVMYSLGLCFGVIFGFGSYNKPNFNCYKSAFFFVGTCCGSSLFFGFVVFSFLGHMAHVQNKNISDVVEGGPGLVFQVFPAELSLLPLPQIWSAIFFTALLGLAIDGHYGIIEGCITALADYFPRYFGHKGTHYWRAGVCFVLMIVGLPQLFDGGIYIFEMLNLYGASGICILWVGFFETIAVGWLYGAGRLLDDVKTMIGYRPPIALEYCLKFVTPTICMAIFIACCIEFSPLKMGNYVYPWWANLIGWMLSVSVVLCIPFVAVRTLLKSNGTLRERWKHSIEPILPCDKQNSKRVHEKEEVANGTTAMI